MPSLLLFLGSSHLSSFLPLFLLWDPAGGSLSWGLPVSQATEPSHVENKPKGFPGALPYIHGEHKDTFGHTAGLSLCTSPR